MFGQQNQQQTSGNVFGAAPQFGQSTGGFSFGAGSNTGAAASSTGGFSFSTTTQQKPAPTGFSLGASSSLATGTPGTTGGFSFGATPAAQATGFKFGGTTSGGFSFSTPTAVTTAPTSTVQTGGLAFGSGTSTGLNFGTAVTQQGSSGFKLGSTGTSGLNFGSPASTTAPGTGGLVLGGTAVTTASSPFTLGKPTASTGPTSGFTLGGTAGQPSGVLVSGTGGLTGSTLSQGFAFGANKTTAPATVTPTPAFSFGGSTTSTRSASTGLSFSTSNEGSAPSSGITLGSGQKTSVAGGLNLGGTSFPSTGTTVAATSAGTGLSFGSVAPAISAATPFSSSFSGLAKTTAAPATGTLSTGIFGGKLPTASTTATPATGTLSTRIFGGKLPTASTTATTTAAGFPGLGGNKFGTTTTTAAGFPGLGGIKFGTTTTTTTSLTTAATTVAARLGTVASTTSASSSSATTSVASSVPQLTYRQLEELINKVSKVLALNAQHAKFIVWTVELTDFEKTFLDQAAQVNAWDRLLMENGEKITDLNASVENVKAEQERLDQELDFIMAQQKELEEMLKPLEEAANISNAGSRQLLQADKERDVTYKLANDIDGQLKQMVQDLKSIIDHLNTANTQQQDSDDPIRQIAKILNAHMNSLQWIDQNSGILQRKVDEISRLSETRRKEQERNFRLAFD